MNVFKYLTVIMMFFVLKADASEDWQIDMNGTMRDIVVTAPSGIDNPPLVIAMHGMNGWHKGYQETTKFDELAEREKFVVVYPNGIDGAWDLSGTRDIELIEAIIDTMEVRYNIDRNRVYPTGWSMGGMMSYHLVCNIPEKIAAIGPTSGYPLRGESGCSNTRPVPIIHIHGNSDGVVTYDGLHPYLEGKVADYGCPAEPEVEQPYPASNTGSNTKKEYWGPCEVDGMSSEIVLITIDGMDHWYTTGPDINESEEIWDFVKDYSLNGTSGFRLTVNTTGDGTVIKDPSSGGYEEGTVVTLTAEPEQGWEFVSWSGDGISSSEISIDVAMDSDKTVSALFSRSPDEEGNYVINGDFSSDDENWTLNVWDGDASGSVVDGEYQISIGSTGSENHQIQLVQPGLFLENGKTYQVSFDAYAEAARELEVNVEMADDPWDSYLPELEYFDLTTENQRYSFTFTMDAETDVNGRLSFNAGASTEDVYIDNVSVKEYNTSIDSPTGKFVQNKGMSITSWKSYIKVDFIADPKTRADINLYNLRGKLVKSESVNVDNNRFNSHIFDLNGMANGIYLIELGLDGRMYRTKKVMIKK